MKYYSIFVGSAMLAAFNTALWCVYPKTELIEAVIGALLAACFIIGQIAEPQE